MANAACKTKNPARFRPGFLHNRSTLPFLPRMALRHKRNQRHTESKAYQQLYEILARFLNLELLHDARSQW